MPNADWRAAKDPWYQPEAYRDWQSMFDLGIEWVAYLQPSNFDRRGDFTIWMRCGCIGMVSDDGTFPTYVTEGRYHGEGRGSPLDHRPDECPGRSNWKHILPMTLPERMRSAEILIEQRWLDEGGCPTHRGKACVH